jgi:hypothetical protein
MQHEFRIDSLLITYYLLLITYYLLLVSENETIPRTVVRGTL